MLPSRPGMRLWLCRCLVLFFVGRGDLQQACCSLGGHAPGPAIVDMLGDQAGFAYPALRAGEVVLHQFFDDRLSHGWVPRDRAGM